MKSMLLFIVLTVLFNISTTFAQLLIEGLDVTKFSSEGWDKLWDLEYERHNVGIFDRVIYKLDNAVDKHGKYIFECFEPSENIYNYLATALRQQFGIPTQIWERLFPQGRTWAYDEYNIELSWCYSPPYRTEIVVYAKYFGNTH